MANDDQILNILFGQPPERAMQYLADKGIMPTKNWYEVLDGANNKAFVVSNVARIDLLNDIKQSLLDAQKNGLTLKQWRENITPILQKKGWWGKDSTGREMGTPHRLETIYRTNMQAAYMAGRRAEMLQAIDTHPYWRYVAVMDGRTRPAHRVLNDQVMPADDPAWESIFPPNGFNCRCRISPMTAGAVERGSYVVESSEDYISTDAVGVGGGQSATITKLKLPSMQSDFKTDAGFNHAPHVISKTLADKLASAPQPVLSTPIPKVGMSENEIIRNALGEKAAQTKPIKNDGAEVFSHLSVDQQRAISLYTGEYYRVINKPLLYQAAPPEMMQFSALLNSALDQSEKYVGVSVRALTLKSSVLDRFIADHQNAMLLGESVLYHAFTSTTKGKIKSFDGNIVLYIEGKNGVFIRPLSANPSENEVLFKSGTGFIVTDLKFDNVVYKIWLREVE